jgi:hypothetical protein
MGRELIRAFMDIVKIGIQADVAFVFAAMISYKVGTLSPSNFSGIVHLASVIFLLLAIIFILLARRLDEMEEK